MSNKNKTVNQLLLESVTARGVIGALRKVNKDSVQEISQLRDAADTFYARVFVLGMVSTWVILAMGVALWLKW